MAAMALQRFHGVDGIGRAFDESPGRDVAEVVGGQVGKQGQPHIGWGLALGDELLRIIFYVLLWQPIFFSSSEGSEKSPGLSGNSVKESGVVLGQLGNAAWKGPARPPGKDWPHEPQG